MEPSLYHSCFFIYKYLGSNLGHKISYSEIFHKFPSQEIIGNLFICGSFIETSTEQSIQRRITQQIKNKYKKAIMVLI